MNRLRVKRGIVLLAKLNGDVYYSTGIPCKNGHIAKRYVSTRQCVECVPIYNEQYEINYPGHKSEYTHNYYASNKETRLKQCAQWKQDNHEQYLTKRRESIARRQEHFTSYAKQYAQDNKAKVNAKTARHRAAKLQATPPWSEVDKILALYEGADYLTRLTGVQWDVDHEVPLQSKIVSGLHVYENLQLLPHLANISKGNRFVQENIQ
jgi:hypothetical protein